MGKTVKLKMLRDVSLVKSPLLTALHSGIKWPLASVLFQEHPVKQYIVRKCILYRTKSLQGLRAPTFRSILGPDFWLQALRTQLVIVVIDALISLKILITIIVPETEILQSKDKKTVGLDNYCWQALWNTGWGGMVWIVYDEEEKEE